MPTLIIEKVYCRMRSESTGSHDEIFLRTNGNKIWPHDDDYYSIEEGHEVDVNHSMSYNEDITIELVEHDSDPSRHDLLGSVAFNIDSLGHIVAQANGDGGSYDIHCRVLA